MKLTNYLYSHDVQGNLNSSSDLHRRAKNSEQLNRGTNTSAPFSPNFIQVQKGKAQYHVNNQGETTLMTRKEFREKFLGEKPPMYRLESIS